MQTQHPPLTRNTYTKAVHQECLVGSGNLVSQLPYVAPILSGGEEVPGEFRAVWYQHDGTEYQAKYSHPKPNKDGKIAKYRTPKGAVPSAYQPSIHQDVWERIATRYGMEATDIWIWGLDSGTIEEVPVELTPTTKIPFFWEWVATQKDVPLHITEGCKKANSLMAQGYLATAIAGVYNGHVVQRDGYKKVSASLVANLLPWVGRRQVILAFDQDASATTRANVTRALKELAGCVNEAGGSCFRVQWSLSQYPGCKGVDDLLVAHPDVFGSLVPKKMVGSFKAAVKEARKDSIAEWKRAKEAPTHEWNQLQLAAPGIPTMTGSGLYVDTQQGLEFADKCVVGLGKVHVIDAPMGSGKTSSVCKALVQAWRAKYSDRSDAMIIYIAPRLSILAKAAQDLGLAKHNASQVGVKEVAVTVESLHFYEPAFTTPGTPILVIADEWSQALAQLHNGATGTQSTPQQLSTLRALTNAVRERGTMLLSEDMVSRYDVHCTGLPLGEYFVFNRVERPRLIERAMGKGQIIERIKLEIEAGGSVCHFSDSNRQCRGIALLMTSGGYLTEDQVLVIDSATEAAIRDRFMRNPMAYVKEHGIKLLACSPSAQSGVSLDDTNGYFTHMTFSLTHLAFRSARQLLGRLRSTAPATGFVAPHGITFQAKGGRLCELADPAALMAAQINEVRATARLANLPADRAQVLADTLIALNTPDTWVASFNREIATSQAMNAYGQANLRDKIEADLIARGCSVGKCKVNVDDCTKSEIDAIFGTRDEDLTQTVTDGKLSELEAAYRAGLDITGLTVHQAIDMRRASDSTQDDRLRAEKVLACHNFPALAKAGRFDCTDGQLSLHRDRFLKRTEILHLLQNQHLTQQARKDIMTIQTANELDPAQIFRLLPASREVALLDQLGILRVVQRGEGFTWSESTPCELSSDIKDRALKLAPAIKSVMRMIVHEEQTAAAVVNKLIRRMGFKIAFKRPKADADGTRRREYYIADLENQDRILALQDYRNANEREYFKSFASPDAKRFVRDAIFAHIRANNLPYVIAVDAEKQLVSASVYRLVDQESYWMMTTPEQAGARLYEEYRNYQTTEM